MDLREAARLDSEGKCAEAEPYYQKALASGNASAALLNNAGNHYLLCGQPEKAKGCFEQLLKSNPDHTNANLQLANIAVEQKQGAKALDYLARVEKQASGNPPLLFALGVAFARLGHYSRAEAAFHAVVQARPADFDALFNLGRTAARAGHHDRARAALETALKIRPHDADALLELGLVHASLQDFSRAVYLLAQARQQAPRRPDVLLALARAAEDAGYYGDSALAYDEYLGVRPGDETARRDRARVLGYTGTRLDEGLKEMAAYVARRPQDPVGHYNLAQFTWRNEPEKSLDQLATAVRLDPKFSPAHVSRAWLLQRLGRSAEAVPHLEAVLKVSPDDVRALDLLGLVYLSLDQPGKAEPPLRHAVASAPQDTAALLHLGQSLMALGRDREAQQFLDKYQEIRPQRHRDPRREPGMIESATLPAAERRAREIERHRAISRSRPDDALLHANLASLLLADGRVVEGVAEFRQLLTLNADAAVCEQAGRVLLQAEEYELARAFLERAAAGRPGARLDLAIATFHSAGPEPALKVIEEIPPGEHAGDFLLMKARLLDAAGRGEEAQKLLTEGLSRTTLRPQVVQQASLVLARYRRYQESADLLTRVLPAAAGVSELHLTHAMVLGLLDSDSAAVQRLREIEARWPEWDRPYIAHGLLLERSGKGREAAQKFRTAAALGSTDPAVACGLARISSSAEPDPKCVCLANLRDWVVRACDGGGADGRRALR